MVIEGTSPGAKALASPALASTALRVGRAGVSPALSILEEEVEGGQSAHTPPFLFEQTPYLIHLWTESLKAEGLKMLLRGTDLLEGRRPFGGKGHYTIPVNFRSEVGFTDLELWSEEERIFFVRLEVFPTKLDYRTDLLELRADLQMEVRSLVFELHGRTFQTLGRGCRSRNQDIDWLTMMREEFERLARALETIIRSPLQRVEVTHEIGRANRSVRPSSTVRQYLRKNLSRCTEGGSTHFHALGKSWHSAELPRVRKTLTSDTAENRYVAAALSKMRMRLRRLRSQLSGLSHQERFSSWTSFLQSADRRIGHFLNQTFLGNLCRNTKHVAPTLALHLTPGYREFFSSALALESVLEVGGGPMEMPEKDLATLYELWCFVALAGILRNELQLQLRPPTWLKVTQRRVALDLRKGRLSVLSLEKDGVECLRVVYNGQDSTPTGDCRPDNTLEIHKASQPEPFRYIFDAKYRLQSDTEYVKVNGAPGPPADAIHRMHAYRDQIVAEQAVPQQGRTPEATIWDLGHRQFVQRTVGAFVLYPYAGPDADQNRFVRAIGQVGVGGVPFLPSRRGEVTRLLKRIIEMSGEAVEDTAVELSTAHERDRIEKAHEYGLIAVVPSREQLEYVLQSRVYHTPYRQHRKWGLRLRADFILFLLSESKFAGESGVAYEAPIRSIHFGQRSEIQPPPPASSRGSSSADPYIWFRLGKCFPVEPRLTYEGHMPLRFAFTTRLAREEARDVSELLLIREPERRFYLECRNAGLNLRVHDETPGGYQVYDVGSLRLRFTVIQKDATRVEVRFDPSSATFKGPGWEFTWTELMFRPDDCIGKLRG